MSDPRMAAINNFTVKQHKSVPPELNPRDAVLPDPFTVCIMGASRGIGEHIAYAYAQAGASRIVISSRATGDLETVARNISDDINSRVKVDLVECDVSSASAVEALAEYVRTRCGRLDLLVLNAGYAGPVTTRMDQGKPEWVRRAFEVNAMGTYLAAHYFVPLLLESPNGAKGFIAVGSFAGCIRRGIIANTGYTVSKMAQIRLVEYLDEQYGQYGLVSLVVHPGAVATKMAEGNTPEEFLPYLTDDVDLCGAVCVWLSKQLNNIHWLSGRLISATWDMAELMSKEQQIREKDLLKFVMVTG
ncbi:hypothetical protein PV08_11787 [Exophiala spinifera]|uniref:Uncharacterized protein n=1 Tax=Exophiala spinifera TaxID=91928 RepID=A0A0D1Y534_9EURO|nr:uncharacterized protein PV08_11787 [Exophiala spinifera]KIW10011.1 hypothetical protein PV08_11787 [Exophiala spinifera]